MHEHDILETITPLKPDTIYAEDKASWNYYCKHALMVMNACGVNPRDHPAVWQQKIILLNIFGHSLEALVAAVEFEDLITTHVVPPARLETSTAIILGLGYYNLGHFSKSCRWYKIAASRYQEPASHAMYLKYAARSYNYFYAQLFPGMVAEDNMFEHVNDDMMFEPDHIHTLDGDIFAEIVYFLEDEGENDANYRHLLEYINTCGVNAIQFPLVWEQKISFHFLIKDSVKAFSAAKDFEETLFNGEIPENFDSCVVADVLGDGFHKNREYRKAYRWIQKAIELCGNDRAAKKAFIARAKDIYSHIFSDILSAFEEVNFFEEADNANFLNCIMLPEPEPEDDVVGDDVELEDDVVEDPPKFKIPFMVNIEVALDEKISEGVFLGVLSLLDKTFIQPTDYQLHSLEKLQNLRDGDKLNPYLVRVDMVVYSPALKSQLLVCQRVVPIDYYFQRKLSEFKDSILSEPEEWWRLIEADVGRIFRDVIQGCRIHYARGLYFGDLDQCIYVTNYGQGRILPSLKPCVDAEDDINRLTKKIIALVRYPFPEAGLKLFNLPRDILHFLKFVRGKKAKLVPPEYLLDHHWIWTPQDCFEFFARLTKALKERIIDRHVLNSIITSFGEYGGLKITWPRYIPTGDFRTVFNKGGTGNIPAYVTQLDLQRYIYAVYSHINDSKNENETYSTAEIEEHLRYFFPDVYEIYQGALFFYATYEGSNGMRAMSTPIQIEID